MAGNPDPLMTAGTKPSGPATLGEKLVKVTDTVKLEIELVIAYPTDLMCTTSTPIPEGIREFPFASFAN